MLWLGRLARIVTRLGEHGLTAPLYREFLEFVHDARARGKRLLGALIGHLLEPPCSPS
jgi:hypothetical protein